MNEIGRFHVGIERKETLLESKQCVSMTTRCHKHETNTSANLDKQVDGGACSTFTQA